MGAPFPYLAVYVVAFVTPANVESLTTNDNVLVVPVVNVDVVVVAIPLHRVLIPAVYVGKNLIATMEAGDRVVFVTLE